MSNVEQAEADTREYRIVYEVVKGWPFEPLTEAYTPEDVVRYARGIGVGMPGPLAAEEARFLREDAAVEALPMMAIVLNQGPMWTRDPGTGIDWTKTVHAEESIVMHQPLPSQGQMVGTYQVDEIYDKGPGKGALMYESRMLKHGNGEPVATVRIATFLRGNGGFGGPTEGAPVPERVPEDRAPDAVLDLATPARDNTTYQLGAEFVDAVKGAGGASEPMLRGVCAFGIAGRAVLKLACGNEPARMRFMSLRYTAPVFAEETLRTELWFTVPGRAAFRVRSLQRDVVVMNNGIVEFAG